MKIDILTLFPEMFTEVFGLSIVKRAIEKGKVEINVHNLRDYSTDSYKTVDDKPYGGGAGMIMKVDIIDKAIDDVRSDKMKVIITDAGGEKFSQKKAVSFSACEHLVIICGHYEGIDHRVHEHLADEVISIGDYVLSGGEIPAMVIVDSVVRLLPDVLGNEKSLDEESHNNEGEAEYPQYTRPEEHKGWKVPEVLMSGNHKEIEKWRKEQITKRPSPNEKKE
jgi:tRNA (guanine37-N1)-methyltransferase